MNATAPKTSRFLLYLAAVLCAWVAAIQTAQAEPRIFNTSEWVALASQTCTTQAPRNQQVAALDLSQAQLSHSCRCVARNMLTILPLTERVKLMTQMHAKRNLQQTAKQMFANPDVKKAVVSCAASYYWS